MTVPSSTYVNKMERWNDQQTQLLDLIHSTLGTISTSTAATSINIDSLPGTVESDITDIKTAVEGATPAGELHIGEVGCNTGIVSVVPSVSLTTYTANDCIGGKLILSDAFRINGGSGVLQSLVMSSLVTQTLGVTVFLFHSDPSNGTYTDNSALDIHDLDIVNCLGWVEFASTDYKVLSDNSLACNRNLGLPIYNSGGTNSNLWTLIRTEGAFKFSTATDTKFTFGVLRD